MGSMESWRGFHSVRVWMLGWLLVAAVLTPRSLGQAASAQGAVGSIVPSPALGALLALKAEIVRFNPGALVTWNESGDPCDRTWQGGVECNQTTKEVIALNFGWPPQKFKGPIPGRQLAALQSLKRLDLANNVFIGEIPDELAKLKSLEKLSLASNKLTGGIPASLGKLPNLESLVLRENQLSGEITPQIGELAGLEWLDLSDNGFTGSLPYRLHQLSKLKKLSVDGNDLSGPLPHWLGSLENLVLLELHNNKFTGTIPSELGDLSRLLLLSIDSNRLTGPIPPSLGKLQRLKALYMNNNELEGGIPDTFRNLTGLNFIDLSYNPNVGGSLPDFFGQLPGLALLAAESCSLSGPLPSTLANMTRLVELWLGGNNLSGPLPEGIGALQRLKRLRLNNNAMEGALPASLCDLDALLELNLQGNAFGGEIPPCLTSLPKLTLLNVASNKLNGTLPALKNDSTLTFSYENNCLTAVPGQLASCTPTPAGLSPPAVDAPAASEPPPSPSPSPPPPPASTPTSFPAPRPGPTTTPVKRGGRTVDLPWFEGIGEGAATAHIKEGDTVRWTWQDDEEHSIMGEGSAEGLFAGPGGGSSLVKGRGFSFAFTFESHGEFRYRCGAHPDMRGTVHVASPEASETARAFVVMGGLLGAIAVLGGVAWAAAAIGRGWTLQPKSSKLKDLGVRELSLHRIRKATKNFTTVLGHGSFGTTYVAERLLTERADARAVVKRAKDPSKHGEFMFKCRVELLARARHRGMVNLIGYCLARQEHILVFEYMPNGTLYERLHEPEQEPFPWVARVKVAVTVACALEHLHHGTATPLLHRDVTSSSIFLAADDSAKLSEFGLSSKESNSGSVRRALSGGRRSRRGRTGASAALLSDRPTEKTDVYDFGVVLLELISGQPVMKDVHITSLAAPFLEDPQMMILMVDSRLGGTVNQHELSVLGGIARECIREQSERRPSMRDIVKLLEQELRLDPLYFDMLGDDDVVGAASGGHYEPQVGRNYSPTTWKSLVKSPFKQSPLKHEYMDTDATEPSLSSSGASRTLMYPDLEMSSLLAKSTSGRGRR